MKDKVLLVSCVFIPEPVVSAQISGDIAISLVNNGVEVTILAPRPSRPQGFDFADFYSSGVGSFYKKLMLGVNVVHLPSRVSPKSSFIGRLLESYSFGKKVSKYISDNKNTFDTVYINSWPIFSQFLIAKVCKRFKIPYIMHIQDIYPESLINKLPFGLGAVVGLILMPLEKYHLRNAKTIIVISENMKAHLLKTRKLDDEQLEVVYNWQDEASFMQFVDQDNSNHKFTFMYLGNIGPLAGIETLINAFYLANLPDCDLVIAGSGANKKSCTELVKKLGVTNILFRVVPAGAVPEIQQEAHVLLLPVIKGGAITSIPSKLPAYMFSAKPILATLDQESDTARAIKESGCGWVGPAEDIRWLKESFIQISQMSQEKLKEKGRLGQTYALTNFSKRGNLEKLIYLIR